MWQFMSPSGAQQISDTTVEVYIKRVTSLNAVVILLSRSAMNRSCENANTWRIWHMSTSRNETAAPVDRPLYVKVREFLSTGYSKAVSKSNQCIP